MIETPDPRTTPIVGVTFTYRQFMGWARRWYGKEPVITGELGLENCAILRIPLDISPSRNERFFGVELGPDSRVRMTGGRWVTKGSRRYTPPRRAEMEESEDEYEDEYEDD